MTIKVRAKVKLMSEDDMELGHLIDEPKSATWSWSSMAIPVEEIYQLISYTPTKTLMITYDGESILILEKFDDLQLRWDEILKLSNSSTGEGKINESSENITEEEEG